MTKEEYQEWREHPITIKYFNYLKYLLLLNRYLLYKSIVSNTIPFDNHNEFIKASSQYNCNMAILETILNVDIKELDETKNTLSDLNNKLKEILKEGVDDK